MSASTRRARIAASAALGLPLLVLLGPFLFTSRGLAGSDFQAGYAPLYEFAAQAWRADGELPRWNPRYFAGHPFVGNPQANLSYPPNGLFLVAPVQRAYEWLVFAHLLLAAGGFYRWMRGLGLRRDSAVIGGLAYSMSAGLLGRIDAGHYPYLVTLCLAPLLLHRAGVALRRPSTARAAGLGAATALVLTGGSPQFIGHLVLFAGAFAAWILAAEVRQGRPWRPAAAALGGGLALGFCLSAVHLFPAAAMAAESSRGGAGAAELRAMAEPFSDFNLSSAVGFLVPVFPWKRSATLWLWHEKALYVGVLPLILAALAFRRSPIGTPRFFAAALGIALLAALVGAGLPRFRVPERIVWIAGLSLSALAALGWEAGAAPPRRKFLIVASLLGATATAALILGSRAPVEAAIFAASFAAALGLVAVAPRYPAVAIGFLALDLCGHGFTILRAADPLPEAPFARLDGPPRDSFRILDLNDLHVGPTVQGFHLLRTGGYPVPQRLCAYYARAWADSAPNLETLPDGRGLRDLSILRRLNVRWIVCRADQAAPEWRPISPGVYEDPGALGAARLDGGSGSVAMERPGTNRLRLTVKTEAPGRVVLSEMYAEGWRATRDGRDVPIEAWEGTLMSLNVPAGASTVEMAYAPASWKIGRGLSIAAALALVALLLLRRRSRPSP